MKNGLYHREINLPNTPEFSGCFTLRYTAHALTESASDRYRVLVGHRVLPKYIKLTEDDPDRVEAEFEDGKCVKLVVRVEFTDEVDIVLVLIRGGAMELTVKTVWFNLWNDKHKTLNRRAYVS